jgi:acetyl-CoA carboxylase biotin carboxyl carrier protein
VNNKELKELMNYIARSGFVEFEMEREGFKLKLVKESVNPAPGGNSGSHAPVVVPAPQPAQASQPPAPVVPAIPAAPRESPPAGIVQVTAPMVGTFYRAPNPDAPSFVETGDRVEKGQVLCIIEAMKLMNEIESEFAGEVVEIPVASGQPVEYGEVLFRIRVAEG